MYIPVRHLSLLPPTVFFETVSLNFGVHQCLYTSWPVSLWHLPVFTSPLLELQAPATSWLFSHQIIMLMWQRLYSQNHFIGWILLKFYLIIYTSLFMCSWIGMPTGLCVEAKGQLAGVSCLFTMWVPGIEFSSAALMANQFNHTYRYL